MIYLLRRFLLFSIAFFLIAKVVGCDAASVSDITESLDEPKVYIEAEKVLTLKADTSTKITSTPSISVPTFNVDGDIVFGTTVPFAFAGSGNEGQTAEISIPVKFDGNYKDLSKIELFAVLYDGGVLAGDSSGELVPVSIKGPEKTIYETLNSKGVVLKTWTDTLIEETVKFSVKGDFLAKTKIYEGKLGLSLKAYSKDNIGLFNIATANVGNSQATFDGTTLKGSKLMTLFDLLGYVKQDHEIVGKISSKLELLSGYALDTLLVDGRPYDANTVFTMEKPGFHHIYIKTKKGFENKFYKKSLYFKIKDTASSESSSSTEEALPESKVVEITGKKMIGYYTNWSQYSRKDRKFLPSNIDPSLYTHIIYGFADIQYGTKDIPDGKGDCTFPQDNNEKCQFRIKPFEWNDIKSHTVGVDWTDPEGHMIDVIKLKEKNKNLNVLVSVGGWNFNDPNYKQLGTHNPDSAAWIFSTMVSSAKYRKQFIDNVVRFCLEYGFDGIDIDWEYPGVSDRNDYSKIGNVNNDKDNFVELLKEMKAEFKKHNLLLAIAVYGAGTGDKLSGYASKIHEYLDWIGLMSYDYHGGWDKKTAAHTPLPSASNKFTLTDGVDYWLNAGVPANKLVLGFATYARGWKGVSSAGYGVTATGPSKKGNYVAEDGILPYYEIKTYLENGYVRYWDDATKTPYLYHSGNKELISYDDKQSYSHKVKFLKDKGLAGAMVWAMDFDMFLDSDGERKNELQKYLHDELRVGDNTTTVISKDTQETENKKGFVKNTSPSFTSSPDTTATEGSSWSYAVKAIDPEGDKLTFYFDKKPFGMKMDFSNIISWTPDGSSAAEEVRIKVTDAKNASAIQSFTVNVTQINDAPKITSNPPLKAKVNSAYSYNILSNDEEGDAISLSLETAPAGMSIAGQTISWTPTAGQEGNHNVVVKVTDTQSASTQQKFSITVVGSNEALEIDDLSLFRFDKSFGSPNKLVMTYLGEKAVSLRGAQFEFEFKESMTGQSINYTSNPSLAWLTVNSDVDASDTAIVKVSIEKECPNWAKDMSLAKDEAITFVYYKYGFNDNALKLKSVTLPNKDKGNECVAGSSGSPDLPEPPDSSDSDVILDIKKVNYSEVLRTEQEVLNKNSNWVLVQDAIRTADNFTVESVSVGSLSNPDNVRRVESIFKQQDWNEIFSEAHYFYTYEKLLKAVAKFPAICQTYPAGHCESKVSEYKKFDGSKPTDCSEFICRKTLGTMFSHFAQETGGHSETGVPYDDKVKEWKEGLVHVEEMGYPPNTPGYNTECAPAYTDKSSDTMTNKRNIVWQSWRFPCPESGGSYYGRGAKQLSYNYNYGAFSEAMYDGDVYKLLNEPRLVAETWLNLASALFFYVYPQPPKPSMLHVLDGTWQPNASDISNGLKPGFGSTIMIINGGVECGGNDDIAQGKNRISYYKKFAKYFDFYYPKTAAEIEANPLGCKKPMKSFHDTGAGAINVYWDTDWSGVGKCKLVGYQTPHSAFKEGDYARCVMKKIPAGSKIQQTIIIDDVADKDPPTDFIDDWIVKEK